MSSTSHSPDPAVNSTAPLEADAAQTASMSAPAPMKLAATVAILEGIAAIGYGISIAVNQARAGTDDKLVESETAAFAFVGVGTALFLLAAFGPMIYGAVNILRGNQWGRSIIVFMNVLLLGIAFYMFSGQATALGAMTLLAALITLGCSLHPASTAWATRNFNARRARQNH